MKHLLFLILFLGSVLECPAQQTITFTAAQFDLNARTTSNANFIETSPLATVSLWTCDGTLDVKIYQTDYASYPESGNLAVYVNGAYHAVASTSANGANTSTVTLPGGCKTVTIYSGGQSATGNVGAYLTGVVCPSACTVLSPPATLPPGAATSDLVVVYGDSITHGYGSTTQLGRYGWVAGLRAHGIRSRSEGWGGRALTNDCNTQPACTTFVQNYLAHGNPGIIWLAIGINDHINNQSAASYQTNYERLLDTIHANLPYATVIAQQILLDGTDTTNTAGSTEASYRTAVTNAASGRSWVVVVTPTQVAPQADVPDTHPTEGGQRKYVFNAAQIIRLYLRR